MFIWIGLRNFTCTRKAAKRNNLNDKHTVIPNRIFGDILRRGGCLT